MPTPPTFVTGQVLTAAQMNTVGMHLIKAQTIGSGVSSIPVTSVFSADYDNYKIVISGGVTGTAGSVSMQMNNSTGSTYRHFGYYGNYGIATLTPYGPALSTQWTDIGIGGATGFMTTIELMSPFLSRPTFGTIWSTSTATAYHFAIIDTSSTSNTGFTITGLGGNTFTGGTIRVYGLRNS